MATRWSYRAELIAACNCDWGCPCNFNARPTYGSCQGAYGAHIVSGRSDDLRLDGLKYVWSAHWPRAIHEGGGTGRLWIEEAAGPRERAALEDILRGRPGGLPWSILAATVDHWLDTSYVPFEWKFDGVRSAYKAGTEVQAALEPMRNPVSGAEAAARVQLPAGIVARELDVTATRVFSVFSKGLKIAAPGKYGFYAVVEHGN